MTFALVEIYSDFDGTLTGLPGSDLVFSPFYQSLFEGYKVGEVKQGYKELTLKKAEAVQALFRDKFDNNREDSALITPEAIEFLHSVLANKDIKLRIITKNRADYIQALLQYQGFTFDEINRIDIGDKHHKGTEVHQRLQERGGRNGLKAIYILDDNSADLLNMHQASETEGYDDITKLCNEKPGKFRWNDYLSEISVILSTSEEISKESSITYQDPTLTTMTTTLGVSRESKNLEGQKLNCFLLSHPKEPDLRDLVSSLPPQHNDTLIDNINSLSATETFLALRNQDLDKQDKESLTAISGAIPCTIKSIDLSWNGFLNKAMNLIHLLKMLQEKLPLLEYLDLSDNELALYANTDRDADEDVGFIMNKVSKFSNLKHLILKGNSLANSSEFYDSLAGLPDSLEVLDLSNNKFWIGDLTCILKNLPKSLKGLIISGDPFDKLSEESIAKILQDAPAHLKYVRFSDTCQINLSSRGQNQLTQEQRAFIARDSQSLAQEKQNSKAPLCTSTNEASSASSKAIRQENTTAKPLKIGATKPNSGSSSNIYLKLLCGVGVVLGAAAIITAFVALNAVTGGAAGVALATIGSIALIASGLGLFASRNKSKKSTPYDDSVYRKSPT